MSIYLIIIILLCILFFLIFFYYLFNEKNKLIKFIVIKEPIENESDFYYPSDKYKIKECKNMCNPEFCNEYQIQRIKYDLCTECKKEGKCYDQYKGICTKCTNYNTCDELFGCNNKPPLDPLNNLCTRCWIK